MMVPFAAQIIKALKLEMCITYLPICAASVLWAAHILNLAKKYHFIFYRFNKK